MSEPITVKVGTRVVYPSKIRRMSKRRQKIELRRRLNKELSEFVGFPVNDDLRQKIEKKAVEFFGQFLHTFTITLNKETTNEI